jgi:hypothetical protein
LFKGSEGELKRVAKSRSEEHQDQGQKDAEVGAKKKEKKNQRAREN